MTRARLRFVALFLVSSAATFAQGGGQGNPFLPPKAFAHYAPDRTYDLIKVTVELDVDPSTRTVHGRATETIAPLTGGPATFVFHAKPPITLEAARLDGRPVTVRREPDRILIDVPNATAGRQMQVAFDYRQANAQGAGFGGGEGGWHWIVPSPDDANRVGFWTQGETDGNSNWVPMWDYPNDFALSETRTTVPAAWTVVGNGALVSDTPSADKKTRTVVWRMDQPHATYLLSLVGGPFDVKKDDWEGTPLWYVVPRGQGQYIDDSFGDTKDMLSFFSSVLGVRYPWPKYAQNAMWDFGGGMENVSATTLGAGSLTDRFEGFRAMSNLNSHELGHQWFGDLATCRDWGQVWLNESFAEFMDMIYDEHARGQAAYERDVAGSTQAYLQEARRYMRPLATTLYPDPDSMFDAHTYPKGGVIIHTLRRQLGDALFYKGLNLYLTRKRHSPAVTEDLSTAMTDATGVNTAPFFDQWVYKPGHPVLDYTWTWDAAASEVVVHVAQTQDTSGAVPVYRIPTKIGLIAGAAVTRHPIVLSEKAQDFRIRAGASPAGVLLDPDLDFLREIPKLHWSPQEWPAILQYAPAAVDRETALGLMLGGTPSAETVQLVVSVLRRDRTPFPVFSSIRALASKKDPELRPFFLEALSHPNFPIRAQAAQALADLPRDEATVAVLRGLVKAGEPYAVITTALRALAAWDAKTFAPTFLDAARIPSKGQVVLAAAYEGLARSGAAEGLRVVLAGAAASDPGLRVAALRSMSLLPAGEPATLLALKQAIASKRTREVLAAATAAGARNEKTLLPDLKQALAAMANEPESTRQQLQRVITRLEGGQAGLDASSAG